MLFDFNEAWPRVAEEQYDVCICGMGPAGITTARKLAARGKKILLLEGGGLSPGYNTSANASEHYFLAPMVTRKGNQQFGRDAAR